VYVLVSVFFSLAKTNEGCKIYDEAVQRLKIAARKGAPVKIVEGKALREEQKNRYVALAFLNKSTSIKKEKE